MRFRRPLDFKCRIVPANPAAWLTVLKLRNLVENLCILFESDETVRAALGNVESAPILRTQGDRNPRAERRRIRPEIERHVPDRAARAAHQFGFLMRYLLIMQPAERSLNRIERDAAL